ncbi:thioredoxin domain-containing protein [Priestia megaterium]|uniref:DsbA family protein n=1 Tax=Priestia megaterium TaxID=1404 RepID=UPI002E1CD54D|nr:thioredoxin domain-containing protein [Priestia megaterium]
MAKKKAKKKLSGDQVFGIVMVVLVVVILLSLFLFSDKLRKNESDTPQYTNDVEHNIDIKNEPTLGDKNAPITLVEYGDYKCPACGYFSNGIMPQLEKDYVSTGKVKVVFKNYPFIYTDSNRAAVYAEGIYNKLGNDAFWQFHKTIYEYQNTYYTNQNSQNEHKDILTEDYLNKTAKTLFGEEKMALLKDVLDDKNLKQEVQMDLKQGRNDNVSSTPSVFINGKTVYEPLNYDAIKGAIDEALESSNSK